jgi:Domain of unknown function (DUF4350)
MLLLLQLSGCAPQPGQLAMPGRQRKSLDARYNTSPAKARLLFDLAHAHPQVPGAGLDKETFTYYGNTSWHSLLKTLGRGGVSSDLFLEGEITRSLLDDYDLFCLYFPEVPARPLTGQELNALEEWVREGGGLFVVGEHTNAGRSSERLNPLLAKFGLELVYGTVVDEDCTYSFPAWDKYSDFTKHPVTQGVRAVGVRTGCPIKINNSHPDRPVGLMASSPTAFLDDWNPDLPGSAYCGDFIRQPDEPQGRYFLLAAATPGAGRVVVVGDHNVFDNVMVRYADNLKLALQAWNWLSREKLDMPVKEQGTTILIPETRRPSDIMMPDASKEHRGARTFYTFFTALNRHPDAIAHCTEFLEADYSAVMVTPQEMRFSRRYLEYLKSQHQKGATIVVMADPALNLGEGTRQVLKEFEVSLDPLPKDYLKKDGELFVGDRSVGRCVLGVYPWQVPGSEVVMKLVTAEREYPIIIQYAPGIQIVLQTPMLRNRSFQNDTGYSLPLEAEKPNEEGLTVFRALWAWIDSFSSTTNQ